MAQDAIANIIASLNRAATPQAIADALKQIKNSLIGHVQRKESAVRSGLIGLLVRIIAAGYHDSNGSQGGSLLSDGQHNELQATVILSSLAAGGPQFTSPLLAAQVDKHLLDGLAHKHASLITARLQGLRYLAASWADGTSHEVPQAPLIMKSDNTALFNDILRQPRSQHSDQQIQLVCELIVSTAVHANAKALLADSDILNTLVALLVSHTISTIRPRYQGDATQLPPAPQPQTIPKILAAIGSIVAGSCYRTYRFIFAASVRDLCVSFNSGEEDIRLMFNRGSSDGSAVLLPQIHTPVQKNVSFHSNQHAFGGVTDLFGRDQPLGEADHLNAVVGWLLVFARKLRGSERLTALHLLAIVNGSIEEAAAKTSQILNAAKARERERQIAFLAVPLAARLVQDALESRPDTTSIEDQIVKDQACEVLYELIRHSKELQIAAVNAGAIKSVCSTLRKSFESVAAAKPLWSPRTTTPHDDISTNSLGDTGLPAEVLHTMKRRLGALHALSALADKEETHRKAIVELNVVSCLIEALKPLSITDLSSGTSKTPRRQVTGNTTDVVLAACKAAQNLSRSVAILRTSLIDAGVAKPVLELLQHPRVEVQIAATDVCTNLLLDFSPMRETLVDLGVMQTLCRHAKDGPSSLRLSSLWALKHLMLQAEAKLKIETLEQLGAHWILHAAEGDQNETYSAAQGGGVALSSANAAGEQIDLLNPASMEVDEPEDRGVAAADDGVVDYDEDGELLYDEPSKTQYQASAIRSTLQSQTGFNAQKQLASIKNAEQNAFLQAKRDDIAIQEQALDFMRNFLNGNDCAAMVDHMFSQIRSQEVFDMLLAKISVLPAARIGRSLSSVNRPVFHSLELVLAALHVLTHIANGNAKHKEMVINQQPLLEALLPHFAHANSRVRVMAVWSITSLTWTDDVQDQTNCRRRAMELRQAGIEHAIRRLSNDSDLDVRERVKVALRQLADGQP